MFADFSFLMLDHLINLFGEVEDALLLLRLGMKGTLALSMSQGLLL